MCILCNNICNICNNICNIFNNICNICNLGWQTQRLANPTPSSVHRAMRDEGGVVARIISYSGAPGDRLFQVWRMGDAKAEAPAQTMPAATNDFCDNASLDPHAKGLASDSKAAQ